MKRIAVFAVAALGLGSIAVAQHGRHGNPSHSPYAGQEKRVVTSLSEGDIAALKAGAGWGLAKPAELNGYPGPLHVLEMAERIGLTAEQRAKVQSLYEQMKARAIPAGERYIAAEQALDDAFRSGSIDKSMLADRLAAAEAAKATLRAVHLEAHLETVPLLSAEQRRNYRALRGYHGNAGHGHH